MAFVSLLLNILVLFPVCSALIKDSEVMQEAAGVFTPARGVLLAVYVTIALASIALIIYPNNNFIFCLLAVQIVYKMITPFTVKTFNNPIVISNLFIALFHSITVSLMLSKGLVEL